MRMLMRSVQSVHGCLQREDFGRPECLSANAGSIGIGLRELGFLNECRTSGLTVRDEWIVKGKSMDMETGYECAKSFSEMKERPEGLFILLDSLALGR